MFLKVMIIGVVLAIWLNDVSQFFMIEDIEGNCKKFWWRNLVLIQNFYPTSEICLIWSWYVAADFHLFIMFSILLALSVRYDYFILYSSLENINLWRHKLFSVTTIAVTVAVAAAYCGYLGIKNSFTYSIEDMFRTMEVLSLPTYAHVGPYAAGVWTGWYLSAIDRNWKINKVDTIFLIDWLIIFLLIIGYILLWLAFFLGFIHSNDVFALWIGKHFH